MSHRYLLGLAATLLLGSCATTAYRPASDVVQQNFIHEYGLEIPQADWVARGSNGEVITIKNSGVIVRSHYQNGLLHGDTTYSFPHSDLVERTERYNQGQLEAEVDHFASGVPSVEKIHRGGDRQEVISWYEDGTPRSTEHLVGDRLVSGEYFSPSHEIESRICSGTGMRIRRGVMGELLSHDQIAQGELIQRITFDVTGHPKEITPYHEGKIHGLRRTFLPGGEPNTNEQWVNGLQHGMTTQYRNGQKYAEIPYLAGQKHGTERRFRNGEEVCEEVRWRFNERYQNSRFYLTESARESAI